MNRMTVVLLSLLPFAGCRSSSGDLGESGRLVVGIRADPQTFNPLLAIDRVSLLVSSQIHAPLLRINRETDALEPQLAESWSFSSDGKALTFKLREGVRFSDGEPFSAADVAFTLKAIHDKKLGSPLAETATVEGTPLTPEVVDPLTVRFHLPQRTAAVERIFDSLYVLPRHRLERALEDGTFSAAFGAGAPAGDVVGLGPFVPEQYQPGERVVLKRNPYYWKKAARSVPLPRLESLVFLIVPDANALLLRFRAGELHVVEKLAPDDFLSLRDSGRKDLRVFDLGEGGSPERLWFNLNPASPSVSRESRTRFEQEDFRRAVSLAIDRESIAKVVYRGFASPAAGPVSPANRLWSNAALTPPRCDPEKARALLDSVGGPVSFTLLTNGDNPLRVKMSALIQEDLARVGIEMHLATVSAPELGKRVRGSFDYEACLFGLAATDTDPSTELPLWQSGSPFHVWSPSERRPATPWEARIDTLMEQQRFALDRVVRKRLYDEVQSLAAEHVPVIHIVVPHTLLGVTARLGNLKPSALWYPLWNSEELYLRSLP